MSTAVSPHRPHRRRWPWAAGIIVVALAAASWWWYAARSEEAQGARRPSAAVVVTTTTAETRDVPVRVTANGTVTAVQSVDLRAQITSTVQKVHIREGQSVKAGELLFSLDSRTEEANLRKAEAQIVKDRSDLATAERTHARNRELFAQKFISQAALDISQNQVDTLRGQLAIDEAALQGARVARAFTEIHAPFAGRTGIINVREGSLVQPTASIATTSAPPLVTVTQIDPITVSFTLPESELAQLQQALARGPVIATAVAPSGEESFKGRITFVDNAVDTTTGTIRLKAEFANPQAKLWPGMYLNVTVSPRTLVRATVVPAQAVQTGPENRFVYVVGSDRKVAQKPVKVGYIDQGIAVVEGVGPGERVVVEGAQNLKPGSLVAEAQRTDPSPAAAEARKAKRES